jgi:glyoxylate reductase
MARIYITRRIPEPAETLLRAQGHEVDTNPEDRILSKAELVQALHAKPYDGILSLLTDKIDAEVFEAAPQAKIVANYAVGFDNIDLVEAKRRNITVTNTPGALTDSVAEHAVALMLALSTRTVEADRFVREGKYEGWAPMLFLGSELKGKTIGILGAGRIGERVVHMCVRGFDMQAIYYDVRRSESIEQKYGASFKATPEEVLAEADIVSLHVPLTPETKHLINKERLARMKKTAFLINTARGPIIDEAALVEALALGAIKGAGLDVFEQEPAVHPGLIGLSNVVLTPHIASATEAARSEMAELAAQNLITFFAGQRPQNAL